MSNKSIFYKEPELQLDLSALRSRIPPEERLQHVNVPFASEGDSTVLPPLLPKPELPPLTEGTLDFGKHVVKAGERITLAQHFGFAFWPDRWEVRGEGAAEGLFLRELQLGCQRLYPRFYNQEPGAVGMVSRKKAQEIEALMQKHHSEGVSCREAMQYGLEGRFLFAGQGWSWVFENKTGRDIHFQLSVHGKEIAD